MAEPENLRAEELVKNLRDTQGVFADPTEDKLLVVTYPKEEVAPLNGFTKKDLESAIQQKLLKKATTVEINGEECQAYMKTVDAVSPSYGSSL